MAETREVLTDEQAAAREKMLNDARVKKAERLGKENPPKEEKKEEEEGGEQ